MVFSRFLRRRSGSNKLLWSPSGTLNSRNSEFALPPYDTLRGRHLVGCLFLGLLSEAVLPHGGG
jgi:hypothetical protein